MKKVITEKDDILRQIEEAKHDLEIARQNEDLADPQFLDVAIEQSMIAMNRLNNLYKQAKLVCSP